MFEEAFIIALVSVVLNIVVPFVLAPIAPMAESMGNQFVTEFFSMMVHHRQTPFVSSVIVAIITFLSAVIAGYLPM